MHPISKAVSALALCGLAASAATAQQATQSPPFSVTVTLSPKAAAKLAKDKETIIVAAYYSGIANEKGEAEADEMGEIAWAENEERELTGAGIASFGAKPLTAKMLSKLEDARPELLINVYSGRRAGPDNILSCDIFQDSIFVAGKEPIRIHCKLIVEP